MMKPLLVLSPGAFVDKMSMQISISAFSNLYHKITPKHQKRVHLTVIEEAENIPKLKQLILSKSVRNSVHIINREDIDETIIAYQTANVFLFPSGKNVIKILSEALSFGMPVLTYEQSDAKNILDPTCSMLCKETNTDHAIEQFSNMLEMLYFDPEVRKILSRGAIEKYNTTLNWGLKSRSMVS